MANDLGLGITISINDAFSAPAERFKQSASGITGALNNIGSKTFVFNQIYEGANHVANALQMVIEPGQAFEKNLKELSAITGVTGAGLDDIGVRARQLAKDFGGSASDAVESYKQVLSKLGPEIAKSPASLDAMGKSILTLSKTMSGDVLGATTALTTSMNIYAGQLTDPLEQTKAMAMQMNVMAAAAQVGSAEVPQIAQSIQVAGLSAKQAGLTFEELNSAIQVMGKGAIYGAEAGTALRNALQIMSQGKYMPKQAREGLEAAGVSIERLGDATIPISQRLTELSKIQGDAALVGEVFGRENSRAARTLFENLPLIDQWSQGISGTQSATEQADIVMGSFSEKMSRMKARFQDIAISVFEATKPFLPFVTVALQSVQVMASLAPAGAAVANIFQGLSTWLSKGQVAQQATANLALAESNTVAATSQRAFTESIAESVAVVPVLATEMAVLNTEMAVLTTETASAAISNAGLAASTAPVATGFMATGAAIWTALAPLLPFIAAGIALVAVYKLVTAGMSDFANMAKEGTEPLTGISGIFQKLGGIITGVSEIFNSWNGSTFELTEGTKKALDKLGLTEFVLGLGTWVVRIKELFSGVKDTFTEFWALIKEGFASVKEAVKPFTDQISELALSMGFATGETDSWRTAGKYLGYLLITYLVPTLISLAVAAAGVAVSFIIMISPVILLGYLLYKLYQGIMAIPDGLAYLSEKWSEMIGYLSSEWTKFTNWINSEWDGFKTSAENIGNSLVEGIKAGISGAWDSLVSMLTGLIAELPGGESLLNLLGTSGVTTPKFNPEVVPEDVPNTRPTGAFVSQIAMQKQVNGQGTNRIETIERNNTTTETVNVNLHLDGDVITKAVNNRNKMNNARGNY